MFSSRMLPLTLPVLALLASSLPVSAALIQPDTATASSAYFDGHYEPEFTIDGSGMPANFTPADAHAPYGQDNHWTSDNSTIPSQQWIRWGFTTPQTLGAMYIWNHRSNGNYAVTSFDLTILDSANNVLLFSNDVALAGLATAQTFNFGPLAGISAVLFEIEQNQGSNFTGLAEVAFETAVITQAPEPATLALAGLGLLGIGLARRRRRA